jgi:hypothetical protein
MKNNHTQDIYNPPSTTSLDFEKSYFNEIDANNLFWMAETRSDNPAYRKIDENTALNTVSQKTDHMAPRTIIFQKI